MAKDSEAARQHELEQSETERAEGMQEAAAEAAPEAPQVGDKVERQRADGETVKDVVVDSGENGTVLARKEGKDHVFVALDPGELEARDNADKQLDLFRDAFGSAAESAVKAAGLKGEAADDAIGALETTSSAVIAEAMGTKNPEAAIVAAVQEHAKAIAKDESEPASPTLGELEQKLMSARGRADLAKSDQEYATALKEIRAIETAVYDLRVAMHPEAGKQEKAAIANQTEGAVAMVADPIYDEGMDAVKSRMQKLEQQMKEADKGKNETAWKVARDEYDRHRVMMPILEKVQTVLDAQAKVDALVKEDTGRQETEKQEKINWQQDTKQWLQGLETRIQGALKTLEDGMRVLDKGPASNKAAAEYAKLEQNRAEKRATLQEVKKGLDRVNSELEALQGQGIISTEKEHQWIVTEANDHLTPQLRDAYKDSPEAVMAYVDKALKDKTLPDSTRTSLENFKKYPDSEPEKIPGTSIALGETVKVKRSSGEVEDGWTAQLVYTAADGERRVYVTKPEPGRKDGVIHKSVRVEELARINEPGAEKPKEKPMQKKEEPEAIPEIPEEEIVIDEPETKPAQTDFHAKQTVEIPRDVFAPKTEPWTKQELSMPDLVKANVLQEGGDLKGWENTFVETVIALEALGMKPADEGLPESFNAMLDTKDSRGFFGKLLRKKTDRVKMFEKLSELKYKYVDSGKVDVTKYLERQKKTMEDYRQAMLRGGHIGK